MKSELRLSSVKIRGCGVTPKNILQIAKKELSNYNEIWCVFDRDNFPKVNFNAAIQMSQSNPKLHCAYSNEAFELWYILHFEYLNSGYSRARYEKKLNEHLPFAYEKNSTEMYQILKDKQDLAVKHADTLLNSYDSFNPESNNPSTTIHILVERLNKLI